jgi:hypothetical protein
MDRHFTWGETGEPATAEEIAGKVGPGWHSIIGRLVDDLVQLGWNGVVDQVKEKFGGLRFYVEQTSDGIQERISIARIESYQTCEMCGEPGSPRGGGSTKTLCDRHAAGRPISKVRVTGTHGFLLKSGE